MILLKQLAQTYTAGCFSGDFLKILPESAPHRSYAYSSNAETSAKY